jgi:hypothetical protein
MTSPVFALTQEGGLLLIPATKALGCPKDYRFSIRAR